MLAGGLVVLLDYAHVPLLIHWPEDANALPDHAIGAESCFVIASGIVVVASRRASTTMGNDGLQDAR